MLRNMLAVSSLSLTLAATSFNVASAEDGSVEAELTLGPFAVAASGIAVWVLDAGTGSVRICIPPSGMNTSNVENAKPRCSGWSDPALDLSIEE